MRATPAGEEVAGEGFAPHGQDFSRGQVESAWDRVNAHLAGGGGFIAGSAPSAADFLATMLMRWSRNMPRPATDWPAIRGYVTRMKARPSFAALYEREGLTEWA